jgi:hypothetical protein
MLDSPPKGAKAATGLEKGAAASVEAPLLPKAKVEVGAADVATEGGPPKLNAPPPPPPLGTSSFLGTASTAGAAGNPPKEEAPLPNPLNADEATGAATAAGVAPNANAEDAVGAVASFTSLPQEMEARFLDCCSSPPSWSSAPKEVLFFRLEVLAVEARGATTATSAGLPNENPDTAATGVETGAAPKLKPLEGAETTGVATGADPNENPELGLTVSTGTGAEAPNEKPAVGLEDSVDTGAAPNEKPDTAAAGLTVSDGADAAPNEKPDVLGLTASAGATVDPNEKPDEATDLAASAATGAPKENPLDAAGVAVEAGAPKLKPLEALVAAGAAAALPVALSPPMGPSQDRHFLASFLFLLMHVGHLANSPRLLAAQMLLVTGATSAAAAAAAATTGAVDPPIGFSQEAQRVAPFLFLLRHTEHLTPSLILLAAQMLFTGAVGSSASFLPAAMATGTALTARGATGAPERLFLR